MTTQNETPPAAAEGNEQVAADLEETLRRAVEEGFAICLTESFWRDSPKRFDKLKPPTTIRAATGDQRDHHDHPNRQPVCPRNKPKHRPTGPRPVPSCAPPPSRRVSRRNPCRPSHLAARRFPDHDRLRCSHNPPGNQPSSIRPPLPSFLRMHHQRPTPTSLRHTLRPKPSSLPKTQSV